MNEGNVRACNSWHSDTKEWEEIEGHKQYWSIKIKSEYFNLDGTIGENTILTP